MTIKTLRLFLCLAFLACPLLGVMASMSPASDEVEPQILVLEFVNGDLVEYELAEKPVVKFSGDNLEVVSAAASAEYASADVKKFYFTLISTSIETATGSVLRFQYTDNENVTVSGTTAKTVLLYDASGRLVGRQSVSDGMAKVSLSALSPGVYILKLDNEQNIKIIRR